MGHLPSRSWNDQPTKKLTKVEVLGMAIGIVLARLNYSCVQDALLEIGYWSLYIITGDVLTLIGVMTRQKALTC
jgi:hypothetical protein